MIKSNTILFTGGSGLLGKEVKKILPDALYPEHSEFDITDSEMMEKYAGGKEINLLLHAAAFTSPPKINENPELAIKVNIIGTANIVKFCMQRNIKLLYISTDYVFSGDSGNYRETDPVLPSNKYAWSKLGGECAVQQYDKSLIVRTSFSANEFPYPKAFIDQWTSRITVSELAEKLVQLIDIEETGILHIGGLRRTVYEYAKSISPDKEIGELSLNDVSFTAPKDTSLNTERYKCVITKKLEI